MKLGLRERDKRSGEDDNHDQVIEEEMASDGSDDLDLDGWGDISLPSFKWDTVL